MRLSIKLRPRAARELAGELPRSTAARSLQEAAAAAGTVLEPTHPGSDDAELRTWFHAEVGDEARGNELLQRLRADEAIEGAFVKPPDESP